MLEALALVVGLVLGAAFIVLLPLLMDNVATTFFSGIVDPGLLENLQP